MNFFMGLKTTNIRGNDQGFTLVEVLFAILIFTVGIMAVAAMSIRAFDTFTQAGVSTVEVNRTVTNIDTVKMVSTLNNQVFQNGQTAHPLVTSVDQGIVTCWDFNNVVVRGVTFIGVENNQIRGSWIRSAQGNDNLQLYSAILSRTQVN